jgi:ribosome-associated translation inhibitor RaiA
MNRLERLEQDLRFFRLQLETERNQFRRNLLLGQIRDVELDILHELQRQRIRVEAENRNLQDALNMAMAMKKK